MEALLYEEMDLGGNDVFKNHDYQGSQYILFKHVEWLAIKHDRISKVIEPPRLAWGAAGHVLIPNKTTNFSNTEIKRLYQEFNNLLFQGIIAPGAVGSCYSLPDIHITEYGFKCLNEKEILPYDTDEFLSKIMEIPNIDEWIVYYVSEALRCFNAGCYNASTIMLGLANEKLIKIMIDSLYSYLEMYYSNIYKKYKNKLQSYTKISEGYKHYVHAFDEVKKEKDKSDSNFEQCYKAFNKPASTVHLEFMRTTRNEVAHPNDVKKERIEVLMLFMAFIDYCKNQYQMIIYFKQESSNSSYP